MATAKGVPMLTDHTRWRIIERTRLKNNEDLKNTTFSSLPPRIKDEHGSSLQGAVVAKLPVTVTFSCPFMLINADSGKRDVL